jgi:hypothetical protein
MKHYYFYFILFLLPLSVFSQTTFYYSLDYDEDLTWGTQVTEIQDKYIIVGLENCNGKGCVAWLSANEEGLFLDRFYPVDSTLSITTAPKDSYLKLGNQHFITATISNPDGTADILINKVNPVEKEIVWSSLFTGNLENIPTTLRKNNSGEIFAYHSKLFSQSPFVSITNLVKLDTLGNIIWQTPIGIEDDYNNAFNHLPLPSGEHLTFYAACEPDVFCQSFFTGYGLYTTKVDESGNELWSRELRRGHYTRWHGTDPVLLDDGLVALNWIHDSLPLPAGEIRAQDMLIWMDQEGEIVNEFFFPRDRERNIRSMTKAANGDIIGAGSVAMDDLELGRGGYVFRMAPDGTLLWERYLADVRFPLDQHFFNDVIESNDGGIVLTGQLQDSFPNSDPFPNNPNVWLVKLDSLGCLEPGCTRFQVMGAVVGTEDLPIQNETSPLRIYPNPTATFAQLQWPSEVEVSYPLEVRVVDLAGRIVLQHTFRDDPIVLQCQSWPPGYYVVQVQDSDGRQWVERLVVR